MVFVRNVKFSAAECNSFNMRKKNVGDLASKKVSGGSNAKLQLSGSNSKYFQLQLGISSNHLRPIPHQSQSSQNCIIIQFEGIFMQFWAILSISIVKLKHVFYTLFYIYSVK